MTALPRAGAFHLPPHLEAHDPPEARGLARDQVRLLVTSGPSVWHASFTQLDRFLRRGDLLVVNDSATLPAALPARDSRNSELLLHFSGVQRDGGWLVEARTANGKSPLRLTQGERLSLPAGMETELEGLGPRLFSARVSADPLPYLALHGRPIRYSYASKPWPLADYQSYFARHPGSSEMPSAGRPFSQRVLGQLRRAGVGLAAITLHTGVASLETGEMPYPEWFEITPRTARAIARTRERGGRVIAVGTTVLRALETTYKDGRVGAGTGWTSHVVRPDRVCPSVDGLLTGLHEPRSTHLWMLQSLMNGDSLRRAYREAVAAQYLWHEFGDSHLILKEDRTHLRTD